MSSNRLAIARVFDLLERAHGVGGRGSERPGWMEQRLFALLEGIAKARATDAMRIAEGLEKEPTLLAEIADTLRVGETRFFRDPAQWQALKTLILPALKVERVRALSVGCSTGEEAYTLGMVIDQEAALFEDGFRVVGMDRSEAALSVARSGVYPTSGISDLPAPLLSRYLSSAGPDALGIAPKLRAHVSFVTRDVMNGLPPGQYEIITCKNMLIYFGEQARARVVTGLRDALAPGGALLVARSEVPLVRALGKSSRLIAPGVFVFDAELR
ncbi:MAG TPA: CheR family methyltransferase [Polyangiaceae bacterium]